jgi:hypothetical protein
MKGYALLTLFWLILIFTVLAQISDRLIIWLNPNAVSLWDERYFYTLVPVIINYVILFLLRKTTINRFLIRISITVNTLLFLYYLYYQYIWDVGNGKLF